MDEKTCDMYTRKYLAIQRTVQDLRARKNSHELNGTAYEREMATARRRDFFDAAGFYSDKVVRFCLFPCLPVAIILPMALPYTIANPLDPFYPFYIVIFAVAIVVSLATRLMRFARVAYSKILGVAIATCRWRQRRIKKKLRIA